MNSASDVDHGNTTEFSMTVKASILLFLLTLTTALPGYSDSNKDVSSPDQAPQASISKSEAADIVKAELGGKVLRVDEVNKDGTPLFRVKILQHGGRIKIVNINGLDGTFN